MRLSVWESSAGSRYSFGANGTYRDHTFLPLPLPEIRMALVLYITPSQAGIEPQRGLGTAPMLCDQVATLKAVL